MKIAEFEELLDYCLKENELIIRMAHRITALEKEIKILKDEKNE